MYTVLFDLSSQKLYLNHSDTVIYIEYTHISYVLCPKKIVHIEKKKASRQTSNDSYEIPRGTGSKQIAKKGVVTWRVGEAAGFRGKTQNWQVFTHLEIWKITQKWRSLLNQRCFSILNLEGMKIVFQSSIFWDRFGKYQCC